MSEEEEAEEVEEKQRFDALLCSLADDFKKYYFELWRRELASQRSTSQFTLLDARLKEQKQENRKLQEQVNALAEHVLIQKEHLNFVYAQTRLLNEQLCELASIINSDSEEKN